MFTAAGKMTMTVGGIVVVPGTFGTFAIGSSLGTYKYTFADNTIVSSFNLLNTFSSGAAAGNDTTGLWMTGSATAINKRLYSLNATVVGTAATTTPVLSGIGVGNATRAIFGIANRTTATMKYTYSGDVVAVAASTAQTARGGAAVGTSAVGIIATGLIASSVQPFTTKYTYSGDTSAAGTNLSGGAFQGAAIGNLTYGIFAHGQNALTTKYTYSGDTVAASTALSANMFGGSGAGNLTYGIFTIANATTTTNKWTYSGDTVAVSTVTPGAMAIAGGGGGLANGVSGVTY